MDEEIKEGEDRFDKDGKDLTCPGWYCSKDIDSDTCMEYVNPSKYEANNKKYNTWVKKIDTTESSEEESSN